MVEHAAVRGLEVAELDNGDGRIGIANPAITTPASPDTAADSAGAAPVQRVQVSADERDYSGGSPQLIKRILSRFPVESTIDFFAECGVELKREETGKLFPTTDKARSVLDALQFNSTFFKEIDC